MCCNLVCAVTFVVFYYVIEFAPSLFEDEISLKVYVESPLFTTNRSTGHCRLMDGCGGWSSDTSAFIVLPFTITESYSASSFEQPSSRCFRCGVATVKLDRAH